MGIFWRKTRCDAQKSNCLSNNFDHGNRLPPTQEKKLPKGDNSGRIK